MGHSEYLYYAHYLEAIATEICLISTLSYPHILYSIDLVNIIKNCDYYTKVKRKKPVSVTLKITYKQTLSLESYNILYNLIPHVLFIIEGIFIPIYKFTPEL